jgi:clorobiocin biosynthesis protein CloN4
VAPTASGDYSFRGRRDHQVKIRGFRIELGDIEAAITTHPQVSEAAVVVSDEGGEPSLHAFCIQDEATLTPAELAAWCADRLPRYMIPGSFHLDVGLPRTSTGKIDRPALLRSLQETKA